MRAVISTASFKSRASTRKYPPNCSRVSANGPSVMSRLPSRTRTLVAVVTERPGPPEGVAAWATVADARLALAILAAAFYRHPSREMQVVGITGTNGKTTTAYLIASIFEAAGSRCGVLGTVGYRIGDEIREATRTTPEAPDVQALLRDLNADGQTMMLVTHDLSLVRSVCDRLLVLDFGRELATGEPDAVLGQPKVAAAYLGLADADAVGATGGQS